MLIALSLLFCYLTLAYELRESNLQQSCDRKWDEKRVRANLGWLYSGIAMFPYLDAHMALGRVCQDDEAAIDVFVSEVAPKIEVLQPGSLISTLWYQYSCGTNDSVILVYLYVDGRHLSNDTTGRDLLDALLAMGEAAEYMATGRYSPKRRPWTLPPVTPLNYTKVPVRT